MNASANQMPTRAASWADALPGLAAAAAGLFALAFLGLALARLAYPYDLDFVENGMLLQAWQAALGRPVFAAPTADFAPNVYMPLYTDLGGLLNQLREGNPSQQRLAANKLCRVGKEAVPHLAYALMSADIGAREDIVACLAALTPPACAALPVLERLVAEGPPVPDPNCKPAECALELREARLVSDMARAQARLRAACR